MKVLDVLSTIGALVLATTPLAVAGAAHAQTATPAHIQVGDLDFGSRADVGRFEARVTKAAEAFCSDGASADLARRSACMSAVHEEAVAKLGAGQRNLMVATTRHPANLRLATAQ